MKRILVLLLAVGLFVGGMIYGVLVHRDQLFPYAWLRAGSLRIEESQGSDVPLGRWRVSDELTDEQQAEMAELKSLGYLSGTQSASDGTTGVVSIDAERAAPGFNLYCSGHGAEAILMDNEGSTVHRWEYSYERAFPDQEPEEGDFRTEFWRKVHLFPNGDILAIFEGLGIIKVDKDSNLLWARHNTAHHDIVVQESGEVVLLTREARIVPEVNADRPVLEDFVTVLTADGELVSQVSVLEAVLRSEFSSLMDFTDDYGDIFHTNTLRILDGTHIARSPHFKAGNALVSLPKLNTVAVIDLETERVVWSLGGFFRFQHDSQLLDNGNLLVFDNSGHPVDGGKLSKVVEIEPDTQEIVWAFYGDPENRFHTPCCGTNQRLPNGNTLITESESGRAFEVTPEGSEVWRFETPHRAGDSGELVATLNEVERLPEEFGFDWLQ